MVAVWEGLKRGQGGEMGRAGREGRVEVERKEREGRKGRERGVWGGRTVESEKMGWRAGKERIE